MTAGILHILPSGNSPEFFLNSEGIIKIKGRGLFGHNPEVYDSIMKWIDEYLKKPAETTYLFIALEYLNSFSTTILVSILRKLSGGIIQPFRLVIQWYYEEDDEDILERGEFISSTLNIPVKFMMTNNISEI
jgi:SiaC family regulatory phosphoprotein